MRVFIKQEEDRLVHISGIVDLYEQDRKKKIFEYAQEISQLEAERLREMDPREKDRITREIRDKAPYDPTNYTPPFEHSSTPYLAGLVLEDDEPRIGKKHYLFGKQGLADFRTQAQVVIDWRKAAVSRLFYEWEEGENYEEEIAGQERTGIIRKKISYGIKNQELLTIKTGSDVLSKQNGQWVEQGGKENATMVQNAYSMGKWPVIPRHDGQDSMGKWPPLILDSILQSDITIG